MNKFDRSDLLMNLSVKQLLLDNSAIIGPIPGFTGLVSTYVGHISQGEAAAKAEEFNASGPIKTKKDNKKILVELMIDYKNKLLAFAATNKNQDLYTECDFTNSEISKMDDTKMKSVSMGFYDRIQTYLVSLAVYGINASTQAAFLAAINAFVSFIPKANNVNSIEAVRTSSFKYYLDLMNQDIKQIDIQMNVFRSSQPSFYQRYKYLRVREKPKVNSLSLRVKTIEAETGLPLPMVTIELELIEENPNGTLVAENSFVSKIITGKTKEKGMAYFRSLAAGMYKVVAYKNGVQTYYGTIAINDGERTDLKIEMRRSLPET